MMMRVDLVHKDILGPWKYILGKPVDSCFREVVRHVVKEVSVRTY